MVSILSLHQAQHTSCNVSGYRNKHYRYYWGVSGTMGFHGYSNSFIFKHNNIHNFMQADIYAGSSY
ncbi:protein of unknown function [Serratia sp. Tan611]|nr:protein of unknown function [Serratia sp. Tan611]